MELQVHELKFTYGGETYDVKDGRILNMDFWYGEPRQFMTAGGATVSFPASQQPEATLTIRFSEYQCDDHYTDLKKLDEPELGKEAVRFIRL